MPKKNERSMKHTLANVLLGAAWLMLLAVPARAEELTINSILTMHQSGAPADIIIRKIDSPTNTLAMTAGNLVTLRSAGVPTSVISAIQAHLPASTGTAPLQPDDARLVPLVRLIETGISESIMAEQVQQSGQTYALSVNDILYLKEHGARDSTIAALMATRTGAPAVPLVAPAELVFGDLELVNEGFWRRDRRGRLVMRGDTLRWEGSHDPRHDFELQILGLEKVWYTCEARSSENFCYQLNLAIVKGGTYRFRDLRRESGSNAAITKVAEALRTYFPRLPFGEPDH
jgi:hypothetical protein